MYIQRHRGDKPGALGIRVGKKILYRPSDINRFLDEQLAETHSSQTHQGMSGPGSVHDDPSGSN